MLASRQLARVIKAFLVMGGTACSDATIHRLDAAINYLEVGRWMRVRGLKSPKYKTRWDLFAAVAKHIQDSKVLFVELGVHQGASILEWAKLLPNPENRFHGFDSFQGLPEDWRHNNPKGTFSTNGSPPTVHDPRIKFFVGWFADTLPEYHAPPHERLVIHFDADLYSSTVDGLRAFQPYIKPGSYLLFDEFCDRVNELRAFDEFLHETGMRFRLLGADTTLAQVAFERIA